MWEINNFHQWESFALSILVGACCSVIYDAFRLDRQLFKRAKLTVFFQDIFIWFLYSIIIFSLMLIRTNGEPRFFVFFGSFIGFLICRLTFSKLVMRLFAPLKRFSAFVRKKYNIFIKGLSKWVDEHIFMIKKPELYEKNKKKQNNVKKLLK